MSTSADRPAPLPGAITIPALAMACAPFLAMAWFAHPTKDDYCFANQMRALGLQGAEAHWYAEATGRFASTALMSVGPWSFGSLTGYKLAGPVLLMLLFVVLLWLVAEVLKPGVTLAGAAIVALTLEVIFLGTMPSPAEGIYWYNGAVVFTLGAVFGIAAVAAGVQAQRSASRKAWAWALAAGAAAVVAAGSNEVVLSLLALVLVVLVAGARRLRPANAHLWMVPLAMTVIAGALDVAAPGNYRRAEATHGLANALSSVGGSGIFAAAAMLEWLSCGAVVLAAIAVVACGGEMARRVGGDSPWRRVPWPVPFLVIAAGVWGALFVTHWASGLPHGPAPKRVLNVVELFFLLGGAAGAFMIGVQVAIRHVIAPPVLRLVRQWSLAGSAILLFGSRNVREAYIDLVFDRASGFNQQLDARYATFRSAAARRDTATVVVPALLERPVSLFFDDITADPAFWSNACVAEYWKIRAVSVQ